ncbi:MAG: caffeoyl-CoA O-methyltransferase [Cryptosporangiaceae bacterium]|jgi:caffeoyl-CoA O-methyltransferase|nr:caffeoyl-CoA O-methyltransferase [Cryptosporangiaceae bacterium]
MTPKSDRLSPELQQYMITHSSTPPDQLLLDLIDETAQLGGSASMQISPEQGQFLTLLTSILGVRNAVEVGTFTGYSSLSIARGLAPGGHLLCCDVSDEWTKIARRYWARAGVEDRIELRLAPALESLRALPADPVIDLTFLDADKDGYIGYWEELVPRTRPGGVLLVDNVFSGGRVTDESDHAGSADAIRAFNAHVVADDRVEAVMLAIADGLTIARRK